MSVLAGDAIDDAQVGNVSKGTEHSLFISINEDEVVALFLDVPFHGFPAILLDDVKDGCLFDFNGFGRAGLGGLGVTITIQTEETTG